MNTALQTQSIVWGSSVGGVGGGGGKNKNKKTHVNFFNDIEEKKEKEGGGFGGLDIFRKNTIFRKQDAVINESTASNYSSMEDSITARLSKLSIDERNKGIHELHGVDDDANNELSFEDLRLKVNEMKTIIATNSFVSSDEDDFAYRKALEINKDYVERIMIFCLRADNYDIEKAAARTVSFFSLKQRLFEDDEKLAREIVLDDLTNDDRIALENGMFQLLQERDRSGRGVALAMGKLTSEVSLDTVRRVCYYVSMSAVRDQEVQRHGLVLIYYLIGLEKFYPGRVPILASLFLTLPLRIVAIHLCGANSVQSVMVKMISMAMKEHYLCRFRSHQGSYLECMYSLLTFGVPKDAWPFNMQTGELVLDAHLSWLESMKKREAALLRANKERNNFASSPPVSPLRALASPPTPKEKTDMDELHVSDDESQTVVILGPMDILVGRGKCARSSPGYLRFHNLIQERYEEYNNCIQRFEKMVISNTILKELQKAGCRFVRNTPDGYVVESDPVALKKIAHAFRSIRQSERRQTGREIGTIKRVRASTEENEYDDE